MQSSDIAIILIEPQMGENIGATARAMKNFGINELRIVNPRDGWPNSKAENMSVGAIGLINKAKIFDNINSAIADREFLYATTGIYRNISKGYIFTSELINDVTTKKKIGIMFGRENNGLTNSEISLADKVLAIDTAKDFSSLNLAHAVAIVSYELFKGLNLDKNRVTPQNDLANKNDTEFFFNSLFDELNKNNFFRMTEKKEQMKFKIRNIFSRIENLEKNELQILHGIVKTLKK